MDSTKIFGPGTKFYGIREKDGGGSYWFDNIDNLLLVIDTLATDNPEAEFMLMARILELEEIERGESVNAETDL